METPILLILCKLILICSGSIFKQGWRVSRTGSFQDRCWPLASDCSPWTEQSSLDRTFDDTISLIPPAISHVHPELDPHINAEWSQQYWYHGDLPRFVPECLDHRSSSTKDYTLAGDLHQVHAWLVISTQGRFELLRIAAFHVAFDIVPLRSMLAPTQSLYNMTVFHLFPLCPQSTEFYSVDSMYS